MVKLRLARVLTVGLVMFLGATMVLAQEQGQRQRGQGGRGGFGGGFGGGVGGVLGLINNESVQKELAADADTVTKLKKISDDSRTEARANAGTGGGREAFEGLSEEERRAKFAELQKKQAEDRAKIVAKFQPQLKEVLSETQYTRLQQIYWQSNLNAALADADVVKALTITQEQTDKIVAVGKEYSDKRRELFSGGRGQGGEGAGREAFTKMQELSKEQETKTLDVLTADQKTKFKELKGKEFDVAQLRGGFGGGQGGRGNRGGNGGNRPAAE